MTNVSLFQFLVCVSKAKKHRTTSAVFFLGTKVAGVFLNPKSKTNFSTKALVGKLETHWSYFERTTNAVLEYCPFGLVFPAPSMSMTSG